MGFAVTYITACLAGFQVVYYIVHWDAKLLTIWLAVLLVASRIIYVNEKSNPRRHYR